MKGEPHEQIYMETRSMIERDPPCSLLLAPCSSLLAPRSSLLALRAMTLRADTVRRYAGMVRVVFSGYDEDPREIYAIPEVRRYVGRLTDEFPY